MSDLEKRVKWMDVEQPNALVEQLKLPAVDCERILRGNAARLLRL